MPETRKVQPDATSRRCDNPECGNRVHWSGQRGRPQLFCDAACRKRAVAAAARLEEAIQSAEQRLGVDQHTYRQERSLAGDLSRLKWLLSAYPDSTRARSRGPDQ